MGTRCGPHAVCGSICRESGPLRSAASGRMPCMRATESPAALLAEAGALLDDVVALRRDLHRRPELGLDLPATQARVLEALDGLPLHRGHGSGG